MKGVVVVLVLVVVVDFIGKITLVNA